MQKWRLTLMMTALATSLACAAVAADSPSPASAPGSAPTASQTGRGSSPAAAPADDPRVSRSKGVEGGVVVLWPRIIPENNTPAVRAVAGSLQKRMVELVAKAAPGRSIDVRPEPERSCPMAGCLAPSLGLLLLNSDNGCAVVAMVTPVGRSATRLVPWAGQITLSAEQIEFRGAPESVSKVTDFVPCDKLMEELPALEPKVEQAFRAALAAH